jgi:transposase
MQNRVAAALEQPCEDLRSRLEHEPQVFMDETPTQQANQKAWLWTAVTSTFAVFAVFSSRAATALPKLPGDSFHGIINCDRAKMYWRAKRLQWCQAHLIRDIQALIDYQDNQVKRLGFDLKREVNIMFHLWHRHKSGELSWETFRTELQPVRDKVNALVAWSMQRQQTPDGNVQRIV